jgi:hypothetical protein
MDKNRFMRFPGRYAEFNSIPRESNMLELTVSSSLVGNSTDPEIFGPPLWFVFHNAANTYPRRPTPYIREGMKQLLINLPLIVPCIKCKEHFHDFLQTTNLDEVVSSKENVFVFFVKVHNYVNRRYGKREMSVPEAKELYGFDNPTGINMRITYK